MNSLKMTLQVCELSNHCFHMAVDCFVLISSDVKKARLLLKSVRETNPKHPPGKFLYYILSLELLVYGIWTIFLKH